ncbi:hypothetical protein ACOME3_001312 [Neoechinorhynchus agilis]
MPIQKIDSKDISSPANTSTASTLDISEILNIAQGIEDSKECTPKKVDAAETSEQEDNSEVVPIHISSPANTSTASTLDISEILNIAQGIEDSKECTPKKVDAAETSEQEDNSEVVPIHIFTKKCWYICYLCRSKLKLSTSKMPLCSRCGSKILLKTRIYPVMAYNGR